MDMIAIQRSDDNGREYVDLYLDKAANEECAFRVSDAVNSPVDLSGTSVVMHIKGLAAESETLAIATHDTRERIISFTPAKIARLGKSREYYIEVKTGGKIEVYARGTLYVEGWQA